MGHAAGQALGTWLVRGGFRVILAAVTIGLRGIKLDTNRITVACIHVAGDGGGQKRQHEQNGQASADPLPVRTKIHEIYLIAAALTTQGQPEPLLNECQDRHLHSAWRFCPRDR